MRWDEIVILTCGVAGVVLAQIPRTQKYACFAGLAGQIGWFSAVSFSSQPGIWLTCVVYALAWAYGLWLHWLAPWLEGLYTTPTGADLTPPQSATTAAGTRSKRKLRLVKS
jgi:hypothetical protein